MPNDAKLGLLTGLAIVLVIALLFFRKESPAAPAPAAPAAVRPAAPPVEAPRLPPPALPVEAPELPPPDLGDRPGAEGDTTTG